MFIANAQNEKYIAAMKKNLALFDSAKTGQDFQNLAASFERIGNAEKTQWLPFYYAGLSEANYGFIDAKADKDAVGTKTLELAEKADAIQKSDETKAVSYMGYILQLLVDPQGRYMTYGKNAQTQLEEGLKLNPNNPRLYFLKGQGVLNTPEFIGGGKAAAKPILEKAVALFETDKPQPLYPDWGKKLATEALEKCK
ncbi:MAG: hypothetical protein DI598_09390 [Pseudopedobacter saltans]|uniref:Tetratricopeptide repeat protein n=1 Tax=Pseudopedobacter saltans TaxID=151895 RepID=A0A2W5F024_9SPHI|nr:MAG: hypothetical protein DI598_09390 [Pseudopedobacter saltans]